MNSNDFKRLKRTIKKYEKGGQRVSAITVDCPSECTNCLEEGIAPSQAQANEIARLTRELSEAREAIYTAPIETDGSGCYKGRAIEWFYLPAVRAVIEEGKR